MDHPEAKPPAKTALRLALEALLAAEGRSAAGLLDGELQAAAGWSPPAPRPGVVPFEAFLEDRAPLLREWLPRGYPVTLAKEGHPMVVLRAPKDRFRVGADVLGLRVTAVGRKLEPTTAADVLRWALILWHKLPDNDDLERLGAEWGYQEARAGAPRLDDQGLAMELARIDGGSVDRLALFRAGYARGWAAAEAGR